MTARPVPFLPQGRHRTVPAGVPGRLRSVLSESLVRNSGYLLGNVAFTAGCGAIAASLLTHLYSVAAVGLSAVAVSAGGMIDAITQFGVSHSLPRFLPTSRHRTALINTVLTVTMSAAFLGAVIALVLPVSAKLYALGGWIFVVIFLAGTTMSSGQTHLSIIFVSDRATKRLTKANVVANLINLAAPAAFLFLGAMGAYLSRVALGVAEFVLLAIVLRKSGHRFRPTLSNEAIRDLRSYAVGAYVGSIIGVTPLWVMPMIILARFGPAESAYWYTAVGIVVLLNGLPSAIARMQLAEAVHRPLERRALVRRAAVLMGSLTVPVFVIAYVAAPLGLALFGHRYVTGSLGPLRWLIVGGIIRQISYLSGNVLYLAKKTFAIALVHGINAVFVIGVALGWAHNDSDIAIAWTIGDSGIVVFFAFFAFTALRKVRGRWEHLGGDQAVTATVGNARQRATQDAQEAGLDMLRHLARLQATGPIYDPADLSLYHCQQRSVDDMKAQRDRRLYKGHAT